MMDCIRVCGIWGGLIPGVTVILAVWGGWMVSRAPSRQVVTVFGALALLPLALGLLGTAVGYSRVNETMQAVGEMASVEIAEHGRKVSRYTTYLGLACTALLLVLTGIGAALTGGSRGERAQGV